MILVSYIGTSIIQLLLKTYLCSPLETVSHSFNMFDDSRYSFESECNNQQQQQQMFLWMETEYQGHQSSWSIYYLGVIILDVAKIFKLPLIYKPFHSSVIKVTKCFQQGCCSWKISRNPPNVTSRKGNFHLNKLILLFSRKQRNNYISSLIYLESLCSSFPVTFIMDTSRILQM